MSAGTIAERFEGPRARRWGGGVVGGLVGGVAMGIVLQLVGLMPLIGAVFGSRTAVGGWIGHLFMSVLFALVFVWVVSMPFMSDFTDTFGATVGAGIVYGALLEVVSGGIILPLVAASIGGGTDIPLPLLPLPGVVEVLTLPIAVGIGHLLYGSLLGIVYAFAQVGQTLPEH